MARAEILAGAQHHRERLLHGDRGVEQFWRLGAEIAVAAILGIVAEVGEQHLAATPLRLGETQQRVQTGMVGGFAFGWREALVHLLAAEADVVRAVERERIGRRAIATGAADFLIIALDGLWQISMGNPADVGLVDAHAEGHRGADDQPILLVEPGLDHATILGLHPAVVMAGAVAFIAERLCQCLGLGAGAAVDDARLPFPRGGEGKNLLAWLILYLESQAQVRAVESVQENIRFGIEQTLADLGAGFGVGGGRESRKWHIQGALQGAEA
mmetsp:Transcript_6466/g.11096  ORF Transcript_6466/g.11096 Transcript_6466/m.11096 type:complete len:271 (+) Transcript_6466:2-814(+)